MKFLENHIEALIFCAQKPLKVDAIVQTLQELLDEDIPKRDVKAAIRSLVEKYAYGRFAFRVVEIGGGYQFLTKPEYERTVRLYLHRRARRGLTQTTLETLSIIAYKQPVTRSEVESIRGVSCDYAVRKLLDKELIIIKGRSDRPGRPLLYATSQKFMEYFGINSMDDLPLPSDLEYRGEEFQAELRKLEEEGEGLEIPSGLPASDGAEITPAPGEAQGSEENTEN